MKVESTVARVAARGTPLESAPSGGDGTFAADVSGGSGGRGAADPVAAGTGGAGAGNGGSGPGAFYRRLREAPRHGGRGGVDLRNTWQVVAGSVLVPLGLVFILIAWYGSAHTPYVQQQIPYLVSGSFAGVGCLVLGGLLYWAHWLYRIYDQADHHHDEQLELMQRTLTAITERLSVTGPDARTSDAWTPDGWTRDSTSGREIGSEPGPQGPNEMGFEPGARNQSGRRDPGSRHPSTPSPASPRPWSSSPGSSGQVPSAGSPRPPVRSSGEEVLGSSQRFAPQGAGLQLSPGRGSSSFVVTASGTLYHHPGCPIIAHHPQGLRTLGAGDVLGMDPCRICLARERPG